MTRSATTGPPKKALVFGLRKLSLQQYAGLSQIQSTALRGPKRTRRMLVKGFPFGIVYRVTDETVLIVAVADSRRRPEYWAERIE